jgi:hypothetical protein
LGEPVFIEFSENAFKIRKNLMIASVISIVVVLADLQINSDSSILGLKFVRLSDEILTRGLIAVTLYLLLHFVWSSFDGFVEWRLRLTGTRVVFQTAAFVSSSDGDYPTDPRQSTLYNWWKYERRSFQDSSLLKKMESLSSKIVQFETRLKDPTQPLQDPHNTLSNLQVLVSQLKDAVESAAKNLNSDRIVVSLNRFDSWFKLFLRSQNLRWLVIEFLFPVLLGCYALLLLFVRHSP